MASRAGRTTNRQAGASDSEDDLATSRRVAADTENQRGVTKMPKAKAAKPDARGLNAGKTTLKRKAGSKQPRQALKDRTNVQAGSDSEEVEAFEDEMELDPTKPQAKRAKTINSERQTKVAKTAEPRKRGRPAKIAPAPTEHLEAIPETQQDPEDIEHVEQSIEIDPDNMNIEQVPTPQPVQRFVQRPVTVARYASQPRASSRPTPIPTNYPAQRERSGSAVAADRRGQDPELRRKLNDVSKRFEDLQTKYDALEEVGKTEAETNFDKLKKATDQRAKDANDLIAALKREIAELRKASSGISNETTSLQKQVATLTERNDEVLAERDALKAKLQESHNENKGLEAKLIAARQQIANSAHEARSMDAVAKNTHRVTAPVSTTEAQRDAKMKENLYSDLTGLIIRNVKRQEGEDVYDCIQTGRNGTLHFHLTIANDSSTTHPKTPSGLSYEESEFAYEPLLDDSRDRDLLNLLPDYLTEEICFPRQHAQKFYTRILDSMSKRIEVVEDDE